jgi:hypothetical protein
MFGLFSYDLLHSLCEGDETYNALKRTFLPEGKGRPPDPSAVHLSNKLLLQLELLKQEGRQIKKHVSVSLLSALCLV